MAELKYAEAIRAALEAELGVNPDVLVIGEEAGQLGGVFTVTEGLQAKFGVHRVIDAPICEAALMGWSIGVAVEGFRPVLEIMFSDFSLLALDQLVNLAAKLRFMSNGQFSVPLVVRMPSGGGTNHGPQHSQSLESIFAHVPGLIVAMPSTASDAYWMTREAINLDDPVVVLESKYLYFRESGVVASDPLPFGRARVARPGSDLSILAAGRMVQRSLAAAAILGEENISCEVVDLRYIWPLDTETIASSVTKTSRAVVVHESVEFGGWGGEVSAWIAQHIFESLDAPPSRIAARRTPIPFQQHLEDQVIPTVDDVVRDVRELAAY